MTPAQVCVLLLVLLGGGTGAPLARAAPAPAPAGRVLHQMIADRLGGAAPAPAATSAEPAAEGDDRQPRHKDHANDYDYYYVYEYDDLPPDDAGGETAEYGPVDDRQAAAVSLTESALAVVDVDAEPVFSSSSHAPEEYTTGGDVSEPEWQSERYTTVPEPDLHTASESAATSEFTTLPVLSSTITVPEAPADASPTIAPAVHETSWTQQWQEEADKSVEIAPVSEFYDHDSRIDHQEVEYATTRASSAFTESLQTDTASSSSIPPSSPTSAPSSTTSAFPSSALSSSALPSSNIALPSSTTSSPSSRPPETPSGASNKKQQFNRFKLSLDDTYHDQLNEVHQVPSEPNEIDFDPQASASYPQASSAHYEEQQGSSSDKVLAYQLRAANLEEPRQQREFFVPPIVRRPYRRRVPLTGGDGRRSNAPSLGDRLAEQVRRQLELIEREETAVYRHPFIPSPPTTTDRPYRHPFIPSPPTTTEKPYKHPFIPTPPSTTEKPYKPPFIPTPPTTTEKPYQPPFIPTPPTTTDRPYQHPYIPTTPAPSAEPYRHPFIPVPPSATERPQARRVGGSGDAAVRAQATLAQALPQARHIGGGEAARAQATIVHEETLEAGFIVGEYGVVHGSGTVRGVKYAADSSVDRSLLEAALAQFLRL